MSEENDNGTKSDTLSNNQTAADQQDKTNDTKNITEKSSNSSEVASKDADPMDFQSSSDHQSGAGIETSTTDDSKTDHMDTTDPPHSDSNKLSSSETAPVTSEPVSSEQSNSDHGNSLSGNRTNVEDSGHTQNGEGFQEKKDSMETNELDQSNPPENGYGNDPTTVQYSASSGASIDEKRFDEESAHGITLDSIITELLPEPESHTPIFKHPLCQFHADKSWLNLQFHENNQQKIKKPDEIEDDMEEPPGTIDERILDRIQGSMIGMALGDALGAHVEFRPRQFLVANPVTSLEGGGTWGLQKGQFTDDTSMALCLANSLIARRDFVPYDQLVRYKWWYKFGYMSSTGQCFDIGNATRQSIVEFEHRQKKLATKLGITLEQADSLSDSEALEQFDVNCSYQDVAGNGALMRLTPVPLFFYKHPEIAVELSGQSGQITHGDTKAYDACRYYGALIVAALQGYTREQLFDREFYSKHKSWFGSVELHSDIEAIAKGSYQKNDGYEGGIRGKGYIVDALEAALWAFWSDEDSFEKGALAAVNLGDDTDTTAAIYGQLAGAYYGHKKLPPQWLQHVYAHKFLKTLSKWIAYEGQHWQKPEETAVQHVQKPEETPVQHVQKPEETPVQHVQKPEETPVQHGQKSDDTPAHHLQKSEETPVQHVQKLEETPVQHVQKSEETPVQHVQKSEETPVQHAQKSEETATQQ